MEKGHLWSDVLDTPIHQQSGDRSLKYHTTGLCCLFFLFQSPLLQEWSCCSPWPSTVRSPRQNRVLFLTPAHLKQLLDLQSERTPLHCPALKIRLIRKAVGRFFCLDFWHGILWIFHLTDMLCLQCLQFFLVSACNTSLLWSLSCNYMTLVCHKVTKKNALFDMLWARFLRAFEKDAHWHEWLDQAHPLQGLCRPERCTYIAKKKRKITTMSEPEVTWFSLNFFTYFSCRSTERRGLQHGELHQTKLCSTTLSQSHNMLIQGCYLFHLLSLHTRKQTKYTKGTWKSLSAVQTGQIFWFDFNLFTFLFSTDTKKYVRFLYLHKLPISSWCSLQ